MEFTPVFWFLLQALIQVFLAIFLVVLTIILIRGFDARRMPDLEKWHRLALKGEFRATDSKAGFTLSDYLDLEKTLFAQRQNYFVQVPGDRRYTKHLRFVDEGKNNPAFFEKDWNRTFEMTPQEVKGGVLLIHGLTDSPYSLRSIAESFRDQGYYVLAIRLPGHGTAPAGLVSIVSEDWVAAVQVGAKHVAERVAGKGPFIMGGYSNGGPLALDHTLNALNDPSLPSPEGLVLFSPAMGITAAARFASFHKVVSWTPFFEKLSWYALDPEIDPFKYNALPKNAARQTRKVILGLQRKMHRLEKENRFGELPPILTFQSVADATIKVRDLLDVLYERLTGNGSELVLFGINDSVALDGLFSQDYRSASDDLMNRRHAFRLTLVTNESPTSATVVAKVKPPNSLEIEETPLGLAWPKQVYSLSHVSIPYPPDDPVYGVEEAQPARENLQISRLALRGERDALLAPSSLLMRLRYNPFHSFMVERTTDWIGREVQGED